MDVIDIHQLTCNIYKAVRNRHTLPAHVITRHPDGLRISLQDVTVYVLSDGESRTIKLESTTGTDTLTYISKPDSIAINSQVYMKEQVEGDEIFAKLKGVAYMPAPEIAFDTAICGLIDSILEIQHDL